MGRTLRRKIIYLPVQRAVWNRTWRGSMGEMQPSIRSPTPELRHRQRNFLCTRWYTSTGVRWNVSVGVDQVCTCGFWNHAVLWLRNRWNETGNHVTLKKVYNISFFIFFFLLFSIHIWRLLKQFMLLLVNNNNNNNN